MLVGPPGVGKTIAIKHGREVMELVPNMVLAPQMVSKEKFIRLSVEIALKKFGKDTPLDQMLDYTCAFPAFLEELGTFVRQDEEFMRVLTDLYDCHDHWSYQTKTSGEDHLRKLYFNILGGITPASLADDFGDLALNMGFLARFILVYSESRPYVDPFARLEALDPQVLVADLKQVAALEGPFKIEDEAKEIVRAWLRAGLTPLPQEVRLASYAARREIHWMKLAMLLCVSRSNSLIITADHCREARTFLLGLEQEMPKALQYFGGTSNAALFKQLHRWARVMSGGERVPIPERSMRQQLVRDVPVQYHDQTLAALVSAGYFEVLGEPPTRAFLPKLDLILE